MKRGQLEPAKAGKWTRTWKKTDGSSFAQDLEGKNKEEN